MKTKNTRVSLKKLVKNKSNKISKLVSKPVIKTKKTGGNHKSKRARSNKKGGLRPFWRWRRSSPTLNIPTPNINNLGVYDDNLDLVMNNVRKYFYNRFGKNISDVCNKKITEGFSLEDYVNREGHNSATKIPVYYGYSITHTLTQNCKILQRDLYGSRIREVIKKFPIYSKDKQNIGGPRYLLYFPLNSNKYIIFGSEHKEDFLAMDYK